MIIRKKENLFIVQLFTLIVFVYFISYSHSHEMWLETETFQIDKNENLEKISEDLNLRLEKMISNNPEQWIWSHNRWK